MDSISLKLVFISDPNSETPEDTFRDIIFEVITVSGIYKRFDSFLVLEKKIKEKN